MIALSLVNDTSKADVGTIDEKLPVSDMYYLLINYIDVYMDN
jgi:hypothetical protein